MRKPAAGQERAARFAIRPYPVELETETIDRDGRKLFIRPIRPDDEPLLQLFFRRLTPEDIRLRFFGPLRELTHEMAARLTQIDYDREMASLLIDGEAAGGFETQVGFISFISWSGLDIGRDRSSPVSHYEAPFEFTGKLRKVTVLMDDDQAVDSQKAAEAVLARE